MKSKWIRKIIGGLSFTSAMFIFQACYGTAQDFGYDLLVEGQVKSKTSGLPIKGIKVSVANDMNYDTTDEEGKFSLYSERLEWVRVNFQDIDSTENGFYRDTYKMVEEITKEIFLDILLQEK